MNKQNILYTLLTLTCAFVSPAVAGDMNSGEKSELVKDLESVFYDFGFAKIEDKEFKTPRTMEQKRMARPLTQSPFRLR